MSKFEIQNDIAVLQIFLCFFMFNFTQFIEKRKK